MNNTLRLVDTNGEVVGEVREGDRILRKESSKHLEQTIPWGKGWSFVKVFDNYSPQLSLSLSGGAVGVMYTLSHYVAYLSNLLCNRSSNNPLNNEDIEKITGHSKPTVVKIMDELVANKVLARVKVGRSYQYYANPYIYCRGTRINKTLEAMFKYYPEKYR